jgi:hypothetical protein
VADRATSMGSAGHASAHANLKLTFHLDYSVGADQAEDGANVGFTVLDRLRAEMLHRVGLSDLLKPSVLI